MENLKEDDKYNPLFKSSTPDIFIRIISSIFNFLFGRYLNIFLLLILAGIITKAWTMVCVLILLITPIYLIRFIISWFSRNYRRIKVYTDSENVTFVKLGKNEDVVEETKNSQITIK